MSGALTSEKSSPDIVAQVSVDEVLCVSVLFSVIAAVSEGVLLFVH